MRMPTAVMRTVDAVIRFVLNEPSYEHDRECIRRVGAALTLSFAKSDAMLICALEQGCDRDKPVCHDTNDALIQGSAEQAVGSNN